MNLLSVLLLLLYMQAHSATDVMSCAATSETNEDCRTYCYKVVKPLLQYFRISADSKEQFDKLQGKLQQSELIIMQLHAKIEASSNCHADKIKQLEAEKENLKLQAKILEQQLIIKTQEFAYKELFSNYTLLKDQAKPQTESEQIHKLQTELEVQKAISKEALEKNDELKNSLLNDRDKLKEEDTSKPNKFVKQAEATSCVPFGYSNDIQTIRLPGMEAFQVSCDSRFAGNGWTIIQRRIDGAVHFNRSWHEYKKGFGNLRAEFWLGLEKLHRITNYQPHELYIHMEDFRNQTRYARYNNFSIGTEQQSYELLNLGEYAGTAGNSLIYHKNVKFFTQERDNNLRCAAQAKSGWWFTNCYRCNLNGVYMHTKTNTSHFDATKWNDWHFNPLKFVQMMIRPKKH